MRLTYHYRRQIIVWSRSDRPGCPAASTGTYLSNFGGNPDGIEHCGDELLQKEKTLFILKRRKKRRVVILKDKQRRTRKMHDAGTTCTITFSITSLMHIFAPRMIAARLGRVCGTTGRWLVPIYAPKRLHRPDKKSECRKEQYVDSFDHFRMQVRNNFNNCAICFVILPIHRLAHR